MSDQPRADFPANWQIASDFDPNSHMTDLKGRVYLNVQMRMVWFLRDQRALIALGLATQPYRVDSELVELDRTEKWAHFRATVVDVLGNTSTAYGSESIKDFADYIEKAATKALGRALIGLGYGTQYAPEMDEAERVVDAPVARAQQQQARAPQHTPSQTAQQARREPAPQPTHDAAWIPERDPDVAKALKALRFTTVSEQHDYIVALRAHLTSTGVSWDKESVMQHMRDQYKQQARVERERQAEADAASGYDLHQLPTGAGAH